MAGQDKEILSRFGTRKANGQYYNESEKIALAKTTRYMCVSGLHYRYKIKKMYLKEKIFFIFVHFV